MVVSPPVGALTATDVRLVEGVEPVVEVAPIGGTVTLLVDGEAIQGGRLDFSQDGHPLSMGTLSNWLEGRGRSRELLDRDGDLEFPDLAPGEYLACLEDRFDREATRRCDSGLLAPGGTLTLDLRSPS
jgi:hypothetical protein